MARPTKKRRICCTPRFNEYGPKGNIGLAPAQDSTPTESICMSLEEYEAIRLIDYIGLTQEAAAIQMEVARTSVQRLYESGRQKLAISLIEGRSMVIQGGCYTECDGHFKNCKTETCMKNSRRF